MPNKRILLLVLVILLGSGFWFARKPQTSQHMRGQELSIELGCHGCHEGKVNDAILNPGSLRGVIPTIRSGASASLYWASTEKDFAAWVRTGTAPHTRHERETFSNELTQAEIRMPAFGTRVNPGQISDLFVYFHDRNLFSLPDSAPVLRGYHVAEKNGCFACHGMYGLEGNTNPGSFKGYIPPWEGGDFEALVHNDEELKTWILDGRIPRLTNNPAARYFLNHQKIQMPVYRSQLSEQDLSDVLAYIRWLPMRNQDTKPRASSSPPLQDELSGEAIFKRSGCTTCHKLQGMQGFTDIKGTEIPPRPRLAYRLQLLRNILVDRESQFNTNQLCHYYRDFANEYDHVHHIILEGKAINTEEMEGATTAMPGWPGRANAIEQSDAARAADLDSLVSWLAAYESKTTESQFIRWRKLAATCTVSEPPAQINSDFTRRNQLRTKIEALTRDHKIFANEPFVTFLSVETSLLDLIGYYAEGGLDFWTLLQISPNTNAHTAVSEYPYENFPALKRYVIVVDRSQVKYRSYFFTINQVPDLAAAPEYFKNIHFDDADISGCFACHASGPRSLRPARSNLLLTEQDHELIHTLNRRIAGYGAVATDWPASKHPDSTLMTLIQHPACADCHNNRLRTPLLRYQLKSIDALLHMQGIDQHFYVAAHPTYPRRSEMPPLSPLTEATKEKILSATAP